MSQNIKGVTVSFKLQSLRFRMSQAGEVRGLLTNWRQAMRIHRALSKGSTSPVLTGLGTACLTPT